MLQEKNAARYYLFALANFLAAFGGGMILGKGIGVISTTFLVRGGSILAFFVGTVLGLFLLQFIPNKWSKPLSYSFSFFGAAASLMTLYVFENYSVDGKISSCAALIFFFLLSIRFGFWFYSRVSRAACAAGEQQKIAWVELGYYGGMALGLIIWEFVEVDLFLGTALIIDAILQFGAGFIDIIANRFIKPPTLRQEPRDNQAPAKQIVPLANQENWHWRLTIAVVLLTIGIQVVTFSVAHQVSERFGYYILAFFYVGVSVAAILCSQFKIRLIWDHLKGDKLGYASIRYHIREKENKISFFSLSLLSLFSVMMAVLGILLWRSDMHTDNDLFLVDSCRPGILLFVCLAAFFYEILALAIMDRIGLEEKLSDISGLVMRAYGLMGVGAAISFWIIGLANSSLSALIFILGTCLPLSILFVRRRPRISRLNTMR